MDWTFSSLLLSLMLLGCFHDTGISCLSLEGDVELAEEFRRLNKPAVRMVETEYGDVYDCVDFYDQPAFDHPLLKDHKHEYHQDMKPTSYPERRKQEEDGRWRYTSMKRIDCPMGTVPIRRMTKEQFVAAKMQAKVHARIHDSNTAEIHGLHVGIVRTRFGSGRYNGGGMSCSVEAVMSTNESQYSVGQMTIRKDPDIIQVGWMVNPSVYKDKRTHGFIYLKTSTSTCFNILCPGFVLVRRDLPIDSVVDPVSHSSGPIYYNDYHIYRDKASGVWYLQVGRDFTTVGYWPQRLFTGLADLADYVDWGGEVYGPPDMASPPMGRGGFPSGNLLQDASIKDVVIINETGDIVVARNTEAFADKEIHHRVQDGGITKEPLYHYLTYGGPGGATGW